MPPTQNPQDYNPPSSPANGQPQPSQPYPPQQAYLPAQQPQPDQPPQVAAPMMEPFGQQSSQPSQQPYPQTAQQAYPQTPVQQYNPAQASSSASQPLKPYHPEFNKPDPVDENPYDFFLNDTSGKKSKGFAAAKSGGKGIGMGKILLVVGGMVSIVVVAAVVLISSSRGTDPSPALLAIAKDQQQIIYITTAAVPILEAQSLQNFAATAQYSTTSAQFQYVDYLKKTGIKVNQKDLTATKFPDVDKVLTAAQTASTYDTTFQTTMQTTLSGYIAKLQKSRAVSTSQSQNAIIDKNIASATLLQQQLGT